jgi:hypothetical protein
MSYSTVVLADSPVSYWRLGEASASGSAAAVDSSGNGHTLTYQGAPVAGQVGALLGDADTAVSFAAAGAHIWNGGPPVGFSGAGACSWELWCKRSSAVGARASLLSAGYYHASGVAGFNLDLTPTQVIAEVRSPGVTEAAYTVAYADALWHQVVQTLTRGGTDVLKLYFDGVEVASTNRAVAGQSVQPVGFNFYVGTDQGFGTYAQATLDEIALYNVALSAGQVAAHYAAAAGAAGPGGISALFLGV